MRSVIVAVCLGLCAAVFAAGCGGTPSGLPHPPAEPEVRISTLEGSSWSAQELRLDPAGDAAQQRYSLLAVGAQPAASLLLELDFDPALRATDVQWEVPPGALSLLVTDRPGLLALGIMMPEGGALEPGELLRFRLAAAAGSVGTAYLARSASAAPQGKFGEVSDLSATLEEGELRFDWSYRNDGDCDQNSEVNVADLVPLSTRLFQRTDDGNEDERDEVLDADGNGEVNPADLTAIGQNYRATVAAYNIYRSTAADPQAASSELLGTVEFPLGSPNPGTRRRFAAQLAVLPQGSYWNCFVCPFAVPEGAVGERSNLAEFEVPDPDPGPLRFELPPSGMHMPEPAAVLSPQLVLLPLLIDHTAFSSGSLSSNSRGTSLTPPVDYLSMDGAPLIVYLLPGGGGAGTATLMLARYSDGMWWTEDISDGVNYTSPQAFHTPFGGAVIVFDVAAQDWKLLSFDEGWYSASSPVTIAAGAADVSTLADADFNRETGRLALVHAYATPGGPRVLSSFETAGGWETAEVYSSADSNEVVTGLSFRFDPDEAQQPWCALSSGTVNADLENTTFLIDTGLTLGRYDGAAWSLTPVAYPDSPLGLDLGFNAEGNPRLAFFAARDYNLNLTLFGLGNYDLSLLFDGAVGDWNGAGFDFSKPFAASINIGLQGGFPPSGINVALDLATGVSLAGPAAVCYALNSGTVGFDTSLTPTGGSLAPGTRFYTTSAGGGYSQSSFFTGQPGSSFSWQSGDGGLACAYLQGVALDSASLGDIGAGVASSLLYWTP